MGARTVFETHMGYEKLQQQSMNRIPLNPSVGLLACLLFSTASPLPAQGAALRPPAVPLVACDPYFSIWSPADKLTDANTVHWTGKPHRLTSMVRIDGKAYRLIGSDPAEIAALPQKNVDVFPTRTIYKFEGDGVEVQLTFTTAALPD